MTPNHVLAKTLRGQAKTQRRLSDEAVRRGAYPDDNDHIDAARLMEQAADRIEFLEALFDFSDPEVVLHHAPNDPLTAPAVVVLRSHYETKR